jgi:hypothetical protein
MHPHLTAFVLKDMNKQTPIEKYIDKLLAISSKNVTDMSIAI